jgi:2-phospho-L-lactate/phosphoenolpyruvate guanylyltransferase
VPPPSDNELLCASSSVDGPSSQTGQTAVLVPIKRFAEAKRRLSGVIDPQRRQVLAQRMAARVIGAASPLAVFVVCDDEEVAAFAIEHGAVPLSEPGRGLNGAVASGVAQLRERLFSKVVIAHSDLPLAHDLEWIASYDGTTIVPDRAARGTNVLCIGTHQPFEFSYGPASFSRHFEFARRIGPVRVLPDVSLSTDIDLPTDLETARVALARAR